MGPSLVFYAMIADAVQRVSLPCSSSADLAPPHTPIARLRPGSHLPKRAEPHHVLASGGDGWHSQRFDRPSPIARLLLQQVFLLPDGWISEIPSGIKILGVKSPLRTTLRWSGTIAYRFNSGCWQSLCRPAMLYQGVSWVTWRMASHSWLGKMCSGPWRSWRVFKFSLTSSSVLEMIKQICIVICQRFGILWYNWRLKNACLILSYHSVLTYHSIFSAKSLEVSLTVFPFCHLLLRHFCHLPLLPSLHFFVFIHLMDKDVFLICFLSYLILA